MALQQKKYHPQYGINEQKVRLLPQQPSEMIIFFLSLVGTLRSISLGYTELLPKNEEVSFFKYLNNSFTRISIQLSIAVRRGVKIDLDKIQINPRQF